MIKPIAILTLSNWGGIAILEIDDYEETVVFCWYDDDPETTQYYYEYNEDIDETEAFFVIGETKYYFHEFMRV